jgi:hypothetical protein
MYEAQIKLIDFGSACIEPNTVYTYIQVKSFIWKDDLLNCMVQYAWFSVVKNLEKIEIFLMR